MSDWPLASDYAGMLQNPGLAFKDPELQQCRIKCNDNRQPEPMSGAFAVVFQAILRDGTRRAVRAFTSQRPGITERYERVSRHLETLRDVPFLASFKYAEKGIRASVRGKSRFYPLVTMDWVPGVTLYQWTHERCVARDTRRLKQAPDRWLAMVNGLAKAEIAHGDLQHNNILVDDGDELRLVDYDCMCVPALVGERNLEIGVVPYQHPGRDETTCLSLSLDNFSTIFIYVALRALAAEPHLWTEFVVRQNYEKLLFRETDFLNPSASDLYARLHRSPDAELSRLAEQVPALYQGRMEDVPPLKDLLFSYDKIRSLLDLRDFDKAVELLDRKKDTRDAPADLQPRIQNAYRRVERRRQIHLKVQAGDEQGMRDLYDPALLDDYLSAAKEVAVARLASRVIPVLDSLTQARQKRQWRLFMQIWDKNLAILDSRASAQPFRAEVESWRPRNRACEAVIRLTAQPEPDPDQLQQAWHRLRAEGGHPELDGHARQIDFFIVRGRAWKGLRNLLQQTSPGSERVDDQLLRDWKDDLFSNWSVALKERSKLDAARKRLEVVARLRQLIQASRSPPTIQEEREIAGAAGALPAGYGLAQGDRVQLAQRRIRAAEQATDAMARHDDLALAEHWAELSSLQGQLLVDASIQSHARLAGERAVAWHAFRIALDDAAAAPGAETDAGLVQQWNEAVFRGWPLAEQQRVCADEARRRRSLLQQLDQRIGQAVSPAVTGEEEILAIGGQFPRDYEHPHLRRLDLARQRLQALQRLRQLVRSSGEEEQILDAWKSLCGLQAEAMADASCSGRAGLAERRLCLWKEIEELLRRLNASPGETLEGELLRHWDETLLNGFPRAEAQRPRLTAAERNVATLRELCEAVPRPLTVENEKAIVRISESLPKPYEYAAQPRAEQARRRLEALERLEEAIRQGTCEQAIVAAADALTPLQGQSLIDPAAQRRVAIARQRVPALAVLENLPPTLPVDQYDEQMRRLWREDLLRDCAQAGLWRPRYEAARRRGELMRRLGEAVGRRSEEVIGEIVCDPLLAGYPLPAAWRDLLEDVRRNTEAARRVLGALLADQRDAFYRVFDARAIRHCPLLFSSVLPTLLAWTREEILTPQRLCLHAAHGRDSVVGVSGNTYRVRWGWPEKRFSDRCFVGLSSVSLNSRSDLERHRFLAKPQAIDRETYDASGCTLFWPDRARGVVYVYVWAETDLGFSKLSSPAVELGRIRPEGGQRHD